MESHRHLETVLEGASCITTQQNGKNVVMRENCWQLVDKVLLT
jgi:hypothetical protein